MKRKLLLAFTILFMAAISQAQSRPSVKLYGYTQNVIPGTRVKGDVDESGKLVKKEPDSGHMGNYRLYLTGPQSPRLYPIALWIKGERYGVKSETVANTPISVTNYNIPSHPKTTTIVPKTTQKVLLLTPLSSTDAKPLAGAAALAQNNELVVAYKWRGKIYYAALGKLTELEPQAMQ